MKILISSGGTKVPIDLVRSITNMSSGNFGSKIGTEILKLGHELVFYKAKGSKTPMTITVDMYNLFKTRADVNSLMDMMTNFTEFFSKNIHRYQEYEYSTFDQYADGLKFIIGVEQPDIIVLAAAASDYGVENYFSGKLRSNDMFNIQLKQLPKLINRIKEWSPQSKLVGFKLLVNSKDTELINAARRSINENGCDMVVANDLRDIKDDNHTLRLLYKNSDVIETIKSSESPSNSSYLAEVVARTIVNL